MKFKRGGLNMNLSMHFILQTLFAVNLIAAAEAATAQAYPTRPIRLVVSFPPGGTPDLQARIVTEKLAPQLGQQIVIDNRGGANGIIAMETVARAPADGYTLVITTVGTWSVHPFLYKLPYDVLKDFAPVAHIATTPGVLAVHPSVQANSVKDLIAVAAQSPGKLNYGSAGVGGFGHMSGALFCVMTKVQMTHISYKGLAQALTDLIGGHIQVSFNSALPTVPHIHSGKVRALAATGAKRMAILPDLPTIAESGVAGYESSTWTAIGAPARTPRAIVQRLNQEINTVLQMRDIQERFAAGGSTVTGGTPEEFREYLKSELAKFQKLVKEAGIKGEAGV
jgi:tripartite-type tricarboxylate transporter receptor subunit TctC